LESSSLSIHPYIVGRFISRQNKIALSFRAADGFDRAEPS
jgi:hypothetical protein